jgi:ATP-dependent Clp protease, protease subunit
MDFSKDFNKFAVSNTKATSSGLKRYRASVAPYIMEERELNVTQMDVFSRLMMDRVIFLGQEIDDELSNVIGAQLLYLDSIDNERPIKLYINSGGGGIYAGLAIYDIMQYIRPSVYTICTGLAASMAAVILSAGTNGGRGALKHSRIMIHQPYGGLEGQVSDMEIALNEITGLKKELYSILATHTNQDYEKIKFDSERDYWMSSESAREYGIIDKVL